MESFPKKYNPKDLHKRSKLYKEKYNEENDKNYTIFSPNKLSGSKKLSYQDFFLIYLRDFFNKKNLIKNIQNPEIWKNTSYEQLFITYWNQIENILSSYIFFSKKNQTLPQIWTDKLERHIISRIKKYMNANYKILDSYSSSKHKIYIPDSDLYLYILEQLRLLWEKWKISKKTQIWYRSFNLQTSIPFEEISRVEKKIPCYTLKYFIWTKAEALPVYVEDIDSCCGDVALLVHPKDKRYNKHIWKNAIIPLCNRQIPIIWDENVNISLNNWIQRICPCYDEESIKLAEKYWLPTDIYVFNKQWLYTEYIHEKAFIWEKRSKYYDNIVWFIDDIWNLAEKWEITKKIPYLDEIHERLTPYKIDQIIIDLQEEKQKTIDNFLENNINYFSSNNNLPELIKEYKDLQEKNISENSEIYEINTNNLTYDENNEFNNTKQEILNELNESLPDSIICNSQLPFWWKFPFIKNADWNLDFFDIEKDCLNWKEDPIQICFDYVLISLIRSWTILTKDSWNENEYKICEYNKFHKIISKNEKKIEYLITYLSKITWEKSEYNNFLKLIENITDEEDSTSKYLSKLIKNCKFLKHEWNQLFIKIAWIINDTINPDFIELCIPCYLNNKWIAINSQTIFDKNEKNKLFKELLIQELLLWKTITNNLLEYSYDKEKEFLWNKQISKTQPDQSQRDTFLLYWENPIRLNLLNNKTFDQRKILLNSIFLKQIRNATRLCVQKNFLPKDIEKILKNQPEDFDNFDISVLEKLKILYYGRESIETYEEYIEFFESFKEATQNVFFSRYLEIQKVSPTKDVQFVCSYFFNFLLTILYPLVPEFVESLQYVSKIKFMKPILSLNLDKTTDYNMKILYNTFIKIKEMKTEYNIKQHEDCNIFIKSTPTIWDIFAENEQIFKNYFHISDINYVRLHEQNPLWYEIFSDDIITLWIQNNNSQKLIEKNTLESIEKEIKNLDDKLILLRQRIQSLPEWEQRTKTEEEYAKTKEEIENLTIKHSLLSSK